MQSRRKFFVMKEHQHHSLNRKVRPWPRVRALASGVLGGLALALCSLTGYGQTVSIGTGTGGNYNIPVNTLYNYSYTQQIYLSTEIGQSGFINTIRFYWQGNGTMTENNDWTVYLGYKTANTFASNTDWVPIAELTEVFSGIMPTPSAAGFTVEIPLAAPFLYDMSLGKIGRASCRARG